MKQPRTNKVASYYWRHMKRYPGLLAGLLISVPVITLVNSYIPPLILANVLNKLTKHQYQGHHIWPSFGHDIVIYVLALVIGLALWRVVDFFSWKLEQHVQQNMAEEVFDHMLRESADFHANHFSGSLVS